MDEIDIRTISCVAGGVCLGLMMYDGIRYLASKMVIGDTQIQQNTEAKRIETQKRKDKIDKMLQDEELVKLEDMWRNK